MFWTDGIVCCFVVVVSSKDCLFLSQIGQTLLCFGTDGIVCYFL